VVHSNLDAYYHLLENRRHVLRLYCPLLIYNWDINCKHFNGIEILQRQCKYFKALVKYFKGIVNISRSG
jgi:hypothetical protein